MHILTAIRSWLPDIYPVIMIIRLLAAVALLPLLLAVPAAAQKFEGTVTIRMNGGAKPGAPPQELQYMARGGNVRVQMPGALGGTVMLAIPAEKKTYLLSTAENAYFEVPISQMQGMIERETAAEARVVRTGRKEMVAGYECEHVTVATSDQKFDICLAKSLGSWVNPLQEMRLGATPEWQRALAREGGFPLKVQLSDGSVVLEVTKVEKKRLANNLFAVPENYTKMDAPTRR